MENDRGVKKRYGMGAAAAMVILLAAIAVHRFACNANPPFERPPGPAPVTPPGGPATTNVVGGGAGGASTLPTNAPAPE